MEKQQKQIEFQQVQQQVLQGNLGKFHANPPPAQLNVVQQFQ